MRLGARVENRAADRGPNIVIGLINIMPKPGMRTAESLFRRLLGAFTSPAKIHLRLFALQNSDGEASDAPEHYEGLDALWGSATGDLPLDGLIVTGTESRTRLMVDEPCWPDLQKICQWAGENTISTIWSCFSAHAAVLHMDGIHRRALSEKLTGIFECEKASNHPLLRNMPDRWPVPHSRYNNLDAAELRATGYEILSNSACAGADSFIKRYKK